MLEPAIDSKEYSGPMRALIERFGVNLAALKRWGPIPASAADRERFRRFYQDWRGELDALDFDALDQPGRIDYLLLRNRLNYELAQLDREAARLAEIATFVPFAATLATLEERRRAMQPVHPRDAAGELDSVTRKARGLREDLEARLKKAKEAGAESAAPEALAGIEPARAWRAARLLGELRETLKNWTEFHVGYDPQCAWWLRKPGDEALAELEKYGKLLREEIAGVKEEGDPQDQKIIGDPIGRAGLEDELALAMLPYTPEELIDIAQTQFAWCEREMERVARDMNVADWKAALEIGKNLHVAPGDYPQLVRKLALEAIEFVESRGLVTVPDFCKELWRMRMMPAAEQKVSPYFLGGELLYLSYPTDDMTHARKLASMRSNNIPFAVATVQHELIPGHHLQLFMAERHRAYRSAFETPFLVEGWALHWEMLLWDLGFPATPEQRVGMLFWRVHRCARIIVTLRFHLGLMSPDEMVTFLIERVGHERGAAMAEVRRYLSPETPPLYQCAYMLGGLQMRALWRELVGAGKMTDREFHDAVLRENMIPIPLIRAALAGTPLAREGVPAWRFMEQK